MLKFKFFVGLLSKIVGVFVIKVFVIVICCCCFFDNFKIFCVNIFFFKFKFNNNCLFVVGFIN